jgi:hypothetical protein
MLYTQITLEQTSNVISIITPIVVLIWFYYSRKQILSKDYYSEIKGIYAGYTEPFRMTTNLENVHAGIIMNIRDADSSGNFRGEFEFREKLYVAENSKLISKNVTGASYSFIGKMNYSLHFDKKRNPFRPKENRTYLGKLYIIERLDISFQDYKMEKYYVAEYKIIHFREMQSLKFEFKKDYKSGIICPKSFVLYKKFGFDFEPYKVVKNWAFNNETKVDE